MMCWDWGEYELNWDYRTVALGALARIWRNGSQLVHARAELFDTLGTWCKFGDLNAQPQMSIKHTSEFLNLVIFTQFTKLSPKSLSDSGTVMIIILVTSYR